MMPRPKARPSPVAGTAERYPHRPLDCGAELAVDVLPQRHTVALCFRMLVGVVDDPPDLTGLGSIVEHTISKGTRRYDGRGLADAFDRLGAQWATVSGRQSMLVRALCLPEFVADVVELVGEMLRYPTFPDDACRVAVELAQQDLRQMEDEPHELLRVMLQRLTLGPVLGRHIGGTPEALARVTPDLVRGHWRRLYHAGRLQVVAAGPVDPEELAQQVERCFAGFGAAERRGREPADFEFQPAREHRSKELEQQYIGITLPGLPRNDPHFPTEQVLLAVLSGGMSGRLFTEVREKQGLVYWVGAWSDHPRTGGAVHLGASTTPQRVDRTYATLLREINRLADDLTSREVERAVTTIVAQAQTRGDVTRARANRIADDLFYFGRPIPIEEKIARIQAVTVDDIRRYLEAHPRDRLSVVTLGPRKLED